MAQTPSQTQSQPHYYVDTPTQLQAFAQENQAITWLGFDTEFISEKRFYPMLCLIQVITEHGVYLIDPMVLEDLTPFLVMVENPAILKITHAGDNDYRLLNMLYGIYPKNLFDTQIAAGFLSNTYPISFQNLVEKEFRVSLNKSFAVTDWEARPISPQQLDYALNDVLYLPELWTRMTAQLESLNRLSWLQEEIAKLEAPKYYESDTMKDFLKSTLNTQLNRQERIFLIRLMAWRLDEAKRRNATKELVLPSKTMMLIAKSMSQGQAGLRQNRMISDKLIQNHWDLFSRLFKTTITADEEALLKQIPKWREESPEQALSSEFLYLLIRDRCLKARIAHTIVVSKSSLRSHDSSLDSGWRKELLGESLIQWMKSQKVVSFEMLDDRCLVKFVD